MERSRESFACVELLSESLVDDDDDDVDLDECESFDPFVFTSFLLLKLLPELALRSVPVSFFFSSSSLGPFGRAANRRSVRLSLCEFVVPELEPLLVLEEFVREEEDGVDDADEGALVASFAFAS